MTISRLRLGGSALAILMVLNAPVWAQDIDFGDNTSTWANDGQCDDPRFQGPGTANFLSPVDQGRDAADCQAAFEAGEISLVAGPGASQSGEGRGDASPTPSAPVGDIDFGDDSGTWANDGECDDPRFGGSLFNHELADASDCRAAYEAGEVTYEEGGNAGGDSIVIDGIDFGDDSGTWANDGECDDPRFGGALVTHELADASDCRAAYEAGEVTYEEGGNAGGDSIVIDGIDFGNDSGTWANDGECDDPRFGGTLVSHEFADASDCRAAYEAGEVTYEGNGDAVSSGDIDFGDDSGAWANDGECDDPRFGGTLPSHELADASDCRAAYEAGEVTYEDGSNAGGDSIMIDGIDFGDDSGTYSHDNECDDPRFTGSGVGVALDDHLMADASDCSTAYQNGTVTLSGSSGQGDFRINFGDDSGSAAFDGECDDPRFQGRGGALELFDANLLADATDCRAAYEAGTVTYNP